jgi:hypothetical protein
MFGVFQNIDPRGVNSSEDARRSSVLYIRKYFVCSSFICCQEHFLRQEMFGAQKKAFQVLLNGLPLDIYYLRFSFFL